MNNIKIILYDCFYIYKILDELNNIFKFDLIYIETKTELDSFIQNLDSYLIINIKKKEDYKNQITFNKLPVKIEMLVEKININILKNSYHLKSNIKIKNYILNINSKEIFYQNQKIKLTEQEVKVLMYLEKSKDAVKVEKLQKEIWGYGKDLETHTVETHIHRLRKKFLTVFNDKNLILSTKNGYLID